MKRFFPSLWKEVKNEMKKEQEQDPTPKLNIEELLQRGAVKTTPHYLENRTIDDITNETAQAVIRSGIPNPQDICNRLVGYYYVSQLHQLQKQKFIRWIKKETPSKISVGGVVIDIMFNEKGTYIKTLIGNGKIVNVLYYDKYYIFQRLSVEEQIVLLASSSPSSSSTA